MNTAVVDIGKPGANFGWAIVGDTTAEGNDIDVCVQTLAAALRIGPPASVLTSVHRMQDRREKIRNCKAQKRHFSDHTETLEACTPGNLIAV